MGCQVEDGIGDVQPPVIVGIARVLAIERIGRRPGQREYIPEQVDGISDVVASIVVAVPDTAVFFDRFIGRPVLF